MSLFRSKVKKYSESEKKTGALGLAIGAVLTAVVIFYWGVRSHLPLTWLIHEADLKTKMASGFLL